MRISLFGQDAWRSNPLQKAVRLLYNKNCIIYDAEYHIKSLMQTDTNISTANVKIKKDTSHIYFIDIKSHTNQREFVFLNDTAWAMLLKQDTTLNIGPGADGIQHSGLAGFYINNFLLVDSNLSENPKIFPVTRREGKIAVVSIPIAEIPVDIDSLSAKVFIDTTTSLISRVKTIAYFHLGDYLYQDLFLSNFKFPPCNEISIPEEFYTFRKQNVAEILKEEREKPRDTLNMLEGLVLHDLNGELYELPEKGLIFLDLWYVGCFPCMKSAPHIETLYKKYKDKVNFYSIDEVDKDTARIRLFEDKMDISFPILIPDKKGYFGSKFNNHGYPHFLILDAATGNLLWDMTGFSENLEEIIEGELKKRL